MSHETTLSRRKFLAAAGAAGLGLGLATACSIGPEPSTPTPMLDMPTTQPGTVNVEEMDNAHEKVVKEFLAGIEANSKVFWPPKLSFTMDGTTKVFNINTKPVSWETRAGEKVQAFSYNGIVPGPEIRVTEGDNLRFICKNDLPESTAIHWHGVHTPNAMDGVPYITQPVIKPGASFTYEFTATPAGTHMYHSHHNAAEQVTKGLLGAFIIEPKDKSKEPAYDSDYSLILNDTNVGLTINGRSFPGTAPIVAKRNEKIRIRFMNEGLIIHPMHLHGYYMKVISKDGAPLASPYMADTLNLAPGERYDVIVEATEPGAWAFHCHILTHAESARGMFGMVTALVVS